MCITVFSTVSHSSVYCTVQALPACWSTSRLKAVPPGHLSLACNPPPAHLPPRLRTTASLAGCPPSGRPHRRYDLGWLCPVHLAWPALLLRCTMHLPLCHAMLTHAWRHAWLLGLAAWPVCLPMLATRLVCLARGCCCPPLPAPACSGCACAAWPSNAALHAGMLGKLTCMHAHPLACPGCSVFG